MDDLQAVTSAAHGKVMANITVHVQQFGGDLLKIPASRKSTVLQLKEAISSYCHVDCLSQQLVYQMGAMHNCSSLEEFCGGDADCLEVAMFASPMCSIMKQLESQGLAQHVHHNADSASAVREKLRALTSHTGELPAHVSEWFTFLFERGIALNFLNLAECVEQLHRHSTGLILLSQQDSWLHCGVQMRHVHLLDTTVGDGCISCYYDYDVPDVPSRTASDWTKQSADAKQFFASLSDYFLFEVKQTIDRKKAAMEHDHLSSFNQRLVIKCMHQQDAGSNDVRVLTPEFAPAFEASTVHGLKKHVSESLAIPEGKLRIIMCGKELCNEQLLADYGIEGGSTVHVIVKT
jgi:hypothetical protein